jgi:hypothetical protein
MKDLDFDVLSKTKEGRSLILAELNNQTSNGYLKERDAECWTLYNNTGDSNEFSYLQKIGDNELPAKIRRIPIQRSKSNILISQQSKRKTGHKVSLIDKKSVNKKLERIFYALLSISHKRVNAVIQDIVSKIAMLDQQKEMMLSQLQQQPQTEEQAAKQQALRDALPFLISQYKQAQDALSNAKKIDDKTMDKINEYFESSYEDVMELYSSKLLERIKKDVKYQRYSVTAFVHKIVTGREYFYVDYTMGDDKLTYEVVAGQNLIFPSIESIEWTQDLPWIGRETVMTKEQIKKTYNFTDRELERVKKGRYVAKGTDAGMFVSGAGQVAILKTDPVGGSSSYEVIQDGYTVKDFWWRVSEVMSAIITPNKFQEGKSFVKFVEGKPVISLEEFYYNPKKRMYINRENEEITYPKSEVHTYNPAKGERFERRYFDVRYKGVVIGDVLMKSEVDPIQPRPFDNFKYVPLPIVGKTYSGVGEYPYSMFWSTRELQKQYWIVSYFRELTFAMAGASGVVFDMSQKPSGMSDNDWYYQMKQGRYLIETLTETGAPKKTSFNQFQRVDQSLPGSIQYFELILQGLDNQIGLIMGVPPQRMGVVTPTDQVGTFERSNEQSMLVTEILYEEHDEVEKQALGLAFNISAQYIYQPGDIIELPDEVTTLWKIPSFIKELRAEVHLEATQEDVQRLKELKQFAWNKGAQGALPIGFTAQIISYDNLKELEKAIIEQAKRQEEIQQLNAQATAGAAEEAKRKTLQMQQAFDEQMKSIDSRLVEAKLKADIQMKSYEIELKKRELAIKAATETVKAGLEAERISNEFAIESGVVNENNRANKMDERLRALEMELQALIAKYKESAKATGSNPKRVSKEHVMD